MKRRVVNTGVLIAVAVGIFSCTPTQSVTNQNTVGSGNSKKAAVLWQQTAAEYKALCYQAFNIAQFRIQTMPEDQLRGGKVPAVVLDLDETVLDNSPYNGYLILENKNYERSSWEEWISREEAELIPGASTFIDFLHEKGIEVYFISNRTEPELSSTINNLKTKGIDVDKEKVLLRKDSREKNLRRMKVAEQNNIIMLIGDNLGDFNNVFEEDVTITERKARVDKFKEKFGAKFIILPNPMYGDWERTLNTNDPDATYQRNRQGSEKYIKSF